MNRLTVQSSDSSLLDPYAFHVEDCSLPENASETFIDNRTWTTFTGCQRKGPPFKNGSNFKQNLSTPPCFPSQEGNISELPSEQSFDRIPYSYPVSQNLSENGYIEAVPLHQNKFHMGSQCNAQLVAGNLIPGQTQKFVQTLGAEAKSKKKKASKVQVEKSEANIKPKKKTKKADKGNTDAGLSQPVPSCNPGYLNQVNVTSSNFSPSFVQHLSPTRFDGNVANRSSVLSNGFNTNSWIPNLPVQNTHFVQIQTKDSGQSHITATNLNRCLPVDQGIGNDHLSDDSSHSVGSYESQSSRSTNTGSSYTSVGSEAKAKYTHDSLPLSKVLEIIEREKNRGSTAPCKRRRTAKPQHIQDAEEEAKRLAGGNSFQGTGNGSFKTTDKPFVTPSRDGSDNSLSSSDTKSEILNPLTETISRSCSKSSTPDFHSFSSTFFSEAMFQSPDQSTKQSFSTISNTDFNVDSVNTLGASSPIASVKAELPSSNKFAKTQAMDCTIAGDSYRSSFSQQPPESWPVDNSHHSRLPTRPGLISEVVSSTASNHGAKIQIQHPTQPTLNKHKLSIQPSACVTTTVDSVMSVPVVSEASWLSGANVEDRSKGSFFEQHYLDCIAAQKIKSENHLSNFENIFLNDFKTPQSLLTHHQTFSKPVNGTVNKSENSPVANKPYAVNPPANQDQWASVTDHKTDLLANLTDATSSGENVFVLSKITSGTVSPQHNHQLPISPSHSFEKSALNGSAPLQDSHKTTIDYALPPFGFLSGLINTVHNISPGLHPEGISQHKMPAKKMGRPKGKKNNSDLEQKKNPQSPANKNKSSKTKGVGVDTINYPHFPEGNKPLFSTGIKSADLDDLIFNGGAPHFSIDPPSSPCPVPDPVQTYMTPEEILDDRLRNNKVEPVPQCGCLGPDYVFNESVEGPYYTQLGAAKDIPALRDMLEKRTGVTGNAIRIEKIRYTGKEGRSSHGCPIAKWIIRRSGSEEKYLCVTRKRPGHFCDTAYIIVVIVAWEGLASQQADPLYNYLVSTLTKFGLETDRRCGSNDKKTCACQGVDLIRRGASFSFGCSWSMYSNGCKFARSHVARKFKLKDANKEEEMENSLQDLATVVAPLYKSLAPDAFMYQTHFEEQAKMCRLGKEKGRPFSGVTACVDFCAHSHKDFHNMQNGCTVVVTLTKHRGLPKPDDEQLHVLPLYVIDNTDEHGSVAGQMDKIRRGALEILHKYTHQARMRSSPLTPKKRGRAAKKDSPAKGSPLIATTPPPPDSSLGGRSSTPGTPTTPENKDASFLHSQDSSHWLADVSFSGNSNCSNSAMHSPEKGCCGSDKENLSAPDDTLSQLHEKVWEYFYSNGTFPSPSCIDKWAAEQKHILMNSGLASNNQVRDEIGSTTTSSSPSSLHPAPHHDHQAARSVPPDNYQNSRPMDLSHGSTPADSFSLRQGRPDHPDNACLSSLGILSGKDCSGEAGSVCNAPQFSNTSQSVSSGGTHNSHSSSGANHNKSQSGNRAGYDSLPCNDSNTSVMQTNDTFITPTLGQGPDEPTFTMMDPTVIKCEWQDNKESFHDPEIGGVAISLCHGAVLFEVAKRELHATTALKSPNRYQPTRISLVFYQHKNLNYFHHGYYEYERKLAALRQKRMEKLLESGVSMEDAEQALKPSRKRKKKELEEAVEEKEEKIDFAKTSAAQYKYMWETSVQHSLTLTTDSIITRWIDPQPMVTGPYQRWV